MKIKQALAALDSTDDDQWTADGLPRVEAVAVLVGYEVSRRQITDANPTFTRPQGSGLDPVGTPPSPEPDPNPPDDLPTDPVEVPPSESPDDPPKEEPAEAPSAESPTEDPQVAAHVEIHDRVVAMSEAEVAGDPERMERAIVEFGRQAAILAARRESIDKRLKDVGRRSARLQAALNRSGRSNANQNQDAIRRYLEAQKTARAERVRRARKFIEAGTTAADVKAQLEGPSKIDAAMRQRKPARSAIRPAYPVTATS